MNPRGEDVAEALREWVKDEIKKGPATILDTGKFFFTVSSSTIGLAITVEKLTTPGPIQLPLLTSFVLLTASIFIAIRMTIPYTHDLTGDIDLHELYSKHVKRLSILSIAWFTLWFLGVSLWVWKLFR